MVLLADEQIKVMALVVSLEALHAPHFLLLVSNGVQREAAAVMPAVKTRGGLSLASVTSILQKFPNASRLSFSEQCEQALIPIVAKRRKLNVLKLVCCDVTDISALAGCASLHTLNLSYCTSMTDVSALAGCASLHTLDLIGCRRMMAAPE